MTEVNWKPIDFQGIITLDQPTVQLLQDYLDEKESELYRTIMEVLPPSKDNTPLLQPSAFTKVSDLVALIQKRQAQYLDFSFSIGDISEWKKMIERINGFFWKYVEVLESTITELYFQLEQISLDQWHPRLELVLNSIKEMILHKIEDLTWAIKRLEEFVWKFRSYYSGEGFFSKSLVQLSHFRKSCLDNALFSSLEKNKEAVILQYNKFNKRYRGYESLLNQVESYFERIEDHKLLSSLEPDTKFHFLKLYELLKLWQLNKVEKILQPQEFLNALKNEVSFDKAITIFKEYYNTQKDNLFDQSMKIKRDPEYLQNETEKEEFIKNIQKKSEEELHLLATTISYYREFIVGTDEDPYARSRLGFSDSSGPEPIQLKPLVSLGYDIENLNELYEKFLQSVKKNSTQRKSISQIDEEIQPVLREMGQPLSSHRMMRNHAEKILSLLQQVDELGSTEIKVIDYIREIFSRLLRLDWKYQVLQGIPLFHQLYAIHQGLTPVIDDRHHIVRIKKFKKLLDNIHVLLKAHKVHSHFNEIELDLNDIKGYLQDFLGYTQRIGASAETIPLIKTQISQALLEYRYLFSSFFYKLRQHQTDGQYIRKQLLFVDQYLETIAQKLHSFK